MFIAQLYRKLISHPSIVFSFLESIELNSFYMDLHSWPMMKAGRAEAEEDRWMLSPLPSCSSGGWRWFMGAGERASRGAGARDTSGVRRPVARTGHQQGAAAPVFPRRILDPPPWLVSGHSWRGRQRWPVVRKDRRRSEVGGGARRQG